MMTQSIRLSMRSKHSNGPCFRSNQPRTIKRTWKSPRNRTPLLCERVVVSNGPLFRLIIMEWALFLSCLVTMQNLWFRSCHGKAYEARWFPFDSAAISFKIFLTQLSTLRIHSGLANIYMYMSLILLPTTESRIASFQWCLTLQPNIFLGLVNVYLSRRVKILLSETDEFTSETDDFTSDGEHSPPAK
jgi:hypothetical protein